MSQPIFPLLHLPNLFFFKQLLSYRNQDILLEKQEHFPKQTFRNRAEIYSPNGKLDLSVPITRGNGNHTSYKDVKICNDTNWQHIHWKTIESCYRNSAYFEFYEDGFVPFYEKKYNFLFDYNLELLQLILKNLKLNVSISITEEFHSAYQSPDFRNIITTKNIQNYSAKPYFQVFEDREGFKGNLSIIDLLFNQGPQALGYL
jgi:hypothetical protein